MNSSKDVSQNSHERENSSVAKRIWRRSDVFWAAALLGSILLALLYWRAGYRQVLSRRDQDHGQFDIQPPLVAAENNFLLHRQAEAIGPGLKNPTSVHDLHATMLHLLGLDHERLTYRYAGRDFRLTDVHGEVIREVVA